MPELRHSEVEVVVAGTGDWSQWRGKVQPAWIAFGMLGNFIENGWKIALRSPMKLTGSLCVIHHQPWNIESAWGRIWFDRMLSETLRAPISKLGQRHRVDRSAADVEDSPLAFARMFKL